MARAASWAAIIPGAALCRLAPAHVAITEKVHPSPTPAG
jgi:hypothetical protein